MAKLILNLRNVPDDEADEVRALLDEHGIAFHETKPSLWGVSGGGIWVSLSKDEPAATRLMAEYQQRRQAEARAQYEAAKRAGSALTIWQAIREDPSRAVIALLGVAFALALLALPLLFLR